MQLLRLYHQWCKSVQIHFIKAVTVHLYPGVLKPPLELNKTNQVSDRRQIFREAWTNDIA